MLVYTNFINTICFAHQRSFENNSPFLNVYNKNGIEFLNISLRTVDNFDAQERGLHKIKFRNGISTGCMHDRIKVSEITVGILIHVFRTGKARFPLSYFAASEKFNYSSCSFVPSAKGQTEWAFFYETCNSLVLKNFFFARCQIPKNFLAT